jgi:hypothetical protein
MDIIYSKCYNGVIMVGGFADGGDSVFNTITSATTQKINQNNCAHEQLFKASGGVEANIATTVTKDNICASGKEGFREMTRQTHTY